MFTFELSSSFFPEECEESLFSLSFVPEFRLVKSLIMFSIFRVTDLASLDIPTSGLITRSHFRAAKDDN